MVRLKAEIDACVRAVALMRYVRVFVPSPEVMVKVVQSDRFIPFFPSSAGEAVAP